MDIRHLLEDFLEYLEIERNRSQKTIENYGHYLTRFIDWSDNVSAENISLDMVRSYRLYLNRMEDKKGNGIKKVTQNYHMIALRNFLKYLAKRDIKTLSAEKIEVGKNPAYAVEFLEPEELDRLLQSAEGADLKSLRNRAILEFLFSAGLRVSELVNLSRHQVNLEKQEFSVRGKGGKVRIVFISNTAKNALEKYLAKRSDIDPALFVREAKLRDNESLRLTPRSVQRIVKYYAAKAGIV